MIKSNSEGSSSSTSQRAPVDVPGYVLYDVPTLQERMGAFLQETKSLIYAAYTPHQQIVEHLQSNYDLLNLIFAESHLRKELLRAIHWVSIPVPEEKNITNFENNSGVMTLYSQNCEELQSTINQKDNKIHIIKQLNHVFGTLYSSSDTLKLYEFAARELIDIFHARKKIIELNYSNDTQLFLQGHVKTLLDEISSIHRLFDYTLPQYDAIFSSDQTFEDKVLISSTENALSNIELALRFYGLEIQTAVHFGNMPLVIQIETKIVEVSALLDKINNSKTMMSPHNENVLTLQKHVIAELKNTQTILEQAKKHLPRACESLQDTLNAYCRLSEDSTIGRRVTFKDLIAILKILSSSKNVQHDTFIHYFESICGYMIEAQKRPIIQDVERNTLLILCRLITEANRDTKESKLNDEYTNTIWYGTYNKMLEILNYNIQKILSKTNYNSNQMDLLIARFKGKTQAELRKIQNYADSLKSHPITSLQDVQPIDKAVAAIEGLSLNKKKKKKKPVATSAIPASASHAADDSSDKIVDVDPESSDPQSEANISEQFVQEKGKEKEKEKEEDSSLVVDISSHNPDAEEKISSKQKNKRSKTKRNRRKKKMAEATQTECGQPESEVQQNANAELDRSPLKATGDATDATHLEPSEDEVIESESKGVVNEPKFKEKEDAPVVIPHKTDEITSTKRKNNRSKTQRKQISDTAQQQRQQLEVVKKADAELGKDLLREICNGAHDATLKPSENEVLKKANTISEIPFHDLLNILGDTFFSGQAVSVLNNFRELKLFKYIFNLHNEEDEVDIWYSNQGQFYPHIEAMIHLKFDQNIKYENFEDNQLELMAILLLPALYSYVNKYINRLDLGSEKMLDALFADKNTFDEPSKLKNKEYHAKLMVKLKNIYACHQSFCLGAQFEYARKVQGPSSQPSYLYPMPIYPQMIMYLYQPSSSGDNQAQCLAQPTLEEHKPSHQVAPYK